MIYAFDDHLPMEKVCRRELGTDAFIVVGIDRDGNIMSFIPNELDLADLLLIIDTLEERKRNIWGQG